MKIAKLIERTVKPYKGWLEERYPGHWIQISTHGTLRIKSAVKDVSRFINEQRGLGKFVSPEIEALANKMKPPPQGVDDKKFAFGYENDEGWQKGAVEPGHSKSDAALIEYISKYPDQWKIVVEALGLTRSHGRHASAFVLSDKPIDQLVPIMSVGGVRVSSYTSPPTGINSVEAVGGIKMDFLGINSLNDIQECIKLVQARNGFDKTKEYVLDGRKVPWHLIVPRVNGSTDYHSVWELPKDQNVFDTISSGNTETVFQFATNAARLGLKHFNRKKNGLNIIDRIDVLAAFTALDRPGPLDFKVTDPKDPEIKHNMLVEYANRLAGEEGSPDVLPIMDELVPETLSVICFQESLQRVYQELTDCTGAQAEEFRSNAAKKNKEKVEAAYPFFIERAANKIGKDQAQFVWESLLTFARYGFNKAHAYSYVTTSYACAYLKYHYPLEWWCSVLKNATKNEINDDFWKYCGHLLYLPDIKKSGNNWEIQGDKIRAPISLLHGVGEGAHGQICKLGPYEDIEDFVKKQIDWQFANATKTVTEDGKVKVKVARSAINRTHVYKMIVAGVMESLFPPDLSIEERLSRYDQLVDKYWKQHSGKKKAGKKTSFPNLTPLGRYQLKKSILPAYGQDIRGLIAKEIQENEHPNVYLFGKYLYLKYEYYNKWTDQTVQAEEPVTSSQRLLELNDAPVPKGGLTVAVACHVDDSEHFAYGTNKNKRALRLTLDVGGVKYKTVLWPKDEANDAPMIEKGSIIIALFNRYKTEKPFELRNFTIVKEPYCAKEEEASA